MSKRSVCRDCGKKLDSTNVTYCRSCAAKRAVERRRKGPFVERRVEVFRAAKEYLQRRATYSKRGDVVNPYIELSRLRQVAVLASVALYVWPQERYQQLLGELSDQHGVELLLETYNDDLLPRLGVLELSKAWERELKRSSRDELGLVILDDTD